MTEISITRTIHEYFDNIRDTEIRQNIIMYMQKYNIGNKGISTKTKQNIR
jgi:putative component of toxin-antitoxin plasmid stabilization module